jgi:hypothetical protein
MSKPKIEIGTPFFHAEAICVPVRFNFPDGTFIERTINWNREANEDDIMRELKLNYIRAWEHRKKPLAEQDARIASLRGKKIMQVTGFDDEPLLPE